MAGICGGTKRMRHMSQPGIHIKIIRLLETLQNVNEMELS